MNDSFFSNGRNSSMDDLINSLFYQMDSRQPSSNSRYYVNGREVSAEEMQQLRRQQAMSPGQDQAYQQNMQRPSGQMQQGQGIPQNGDSFLEKIGRNLTQEARDGLLDDVVGRQKEIQQASEILSRRTKNNPVLVGDAGVGKTAIVEGLAQAIVAGHVPASIKNKEIYSIDISNLEAGTQFRGAFEENIKNLIDEVKERGNVILFFDEIHQILGAGSTGGEDGGKGLADIIKPALSRGEISLIGATTQDEYRNTILKNSALARRFNEVTVQAPNKEEALEILKGIRKLYEEHHNVEFSDDALKAAVDYSIQYIPQRNLPDKAIDLVDMTAAHLSAQNPVDDKVDIENKLEKAQYDKYVAQQQEDFNKAAELKDQVDDLQKQLDDYEENNAPIKVQSSDIAETVERLTGIPVSQMNADDIEHIKTMNQRLKGKVIGQDEALEMVSKAIRRNRAGFDEGNRPIGSFLFVGPTGVGKTELAKQLAKDMFGDKDAVIRLDMSEYTDATAVSKLIGTTAGYVGYDDNSNTLTEQVRRNPYSIILLDEIEKANPQVLTLLLQVLDDGRLTDGQGNVVNFKNTVIIATSNAGFGYGDLDGDEEDDRKIEEKLAPYFRPEFLNRFNGIVEFSHLSKENLKEIIDLMITDVNHTLAKKGLSLVVTDNAKDWLIDQGYDEAMGARPLRRVVEQQLRDKITDYYLDHLDATELQADLVDDTIEISEIN